MDSDDGNHRCRWLGSPIRTSPDHRLCASPRGFSQLTTSFFAFLRLGIPTHALSSLTIKSISNTEHSRPTAVASGEWRVTSPCERRPSPDHHPAALGTCCICPSSYSIFKDQNYSRMNERSAPGVRPDTRHSSLASRHSRNGVSWTPAGRQARPKHFADCSSKEKPEAWTGKAATYSIPYTGTASVTPATVSLERR